MKKKIPDIQGDNVYLRQIVKEDLEIVMEWRNRPEIMNCFFNRNLLTLEGQMIWFSRYTSDQSDHMFMIVTNDGIPIGTMALYHIDFDNSKAEYGRALIADDRYRGKGIAYEALKLILRYAFINLNLNKVYLEVFSDNTSAIKLYEKCCFVKEGILRENFKDGDNFRDVLVMSALRRDYEPNNK